MKYIVHLIGIVILSFFYACTPESLEIEIPELPPQIVVFSQVIPGEVMTVSLTRTLGALDFSEEEGDTLNNNIVNNLLVTNAEVTVSYRDVTDTLFEIGAGVYASITTPQYTNELYTLKVVTDDGETITASSEMLPIVPFKSITPEVVRSMDDTLVAINFEIEDAPETNWYMINFYKPSDENNNGIDLNDFFGSGSNVLIKTELISDVAFDGDTFEGTIELPSVSTTDSLLVTLSNINEDYYRFLEIRATSDNFFTELTKEPTPTPTNVIGGLGFFNTHFPDLHFYDLNEY